MAKISPSRDLRERVAYGSGIMCSPGVGPWTRIGLTPRSSKALRRGSVGVAVTVRLSLGSNGMV